MRIRSSWPLGLCLLGASVGIMYLAASATIAGGLGFPLDDSWIHQALARNLAYNGALSINPGETTTATTSPLWTAMVAVGYKLGVPNLAWAYGVGLLSHIASAWTLLLIGLAIFPERKPWAYLAAGLTLLDWRLTWAAVSGMETGLFTLLSLLLIALTLRRSSNVAIGLVGGLATLSRPEGSVLFIWVLAYKWVRRLAEAQGTEGDVNLSRLRALLWETRGFLLSALPGVLLFLALVLPYLYFNYEASGSVFASTFYAKNAFYATGSALHRVARYFYETALVLLSGALLLLLLGVMYTVWRAARSFAASKPGPDIKQAWDILLPLVWVGLLWVMYYLWLPAPSVHHGRYLMPAMPLLYLLGVAGSAGLLERVGETRWPRRFWAFVLAFSLAWSVSGALIYSCNVAFIQDNQVAAALWMRVNTAPESWVAAHDVGAMAYFSNRRVLDTVGLITPELRKTPGDETKVVSLMQERGAGVMALFPSWHPWVLSDKRFTLAAKMLHQCAFTFPGEDMLIMRFSAP